MKFILSIVFVFILTSYSFSQDNTGRVIPNINIKTLQGQHTNTSVIENDGKPIILAFWASWCRPCIQELSAIAEVYDEWQEETGVKLVAVATDDARTVRNVMPLINSRAWDYEFYLDDNSDFRRAMGVNLLPHTFILNGNREVYQQFTAFGEGGEVKLIEAVKEILEKENKKE